jgi:hypothetical protein
MNPDVRTKRSLLIAAAAILVVAVVWLVILESGSYTRKVCQRINGFGYIVGPSDLYSKGYGRLTSIDAVLDEDLDVIREQSLSCGFGGDTSKIGNVELLLWNMDGENVMVIWLVDREPELVFIENRSTGETRPIG